MMIYENIVHSQGGCDEKEWKTHEKENTKQLNASSISSCRKHLLEMLRRLH